MEKPYGMGLALKLPPEMARHFHDEATSIPPPLLQGSISSSEGGLEGTDE